MNLFSFNENKDKKDIPYKPHILERNEKSSTFSKT